MSFWEDLDFSKVAESISENAGDWIDGAVEAYQREESAQPESNNEAAKSVTFGDGKEAPTVTVDAPQTMQPIISGIDNKTLALGVVGVLALILVVKG